MTKLLELLQLGDSSFPIGGYAYSYGLEAARQTGQIPDSNSLKEYLHHYLRNQATGEMPFLVFPSGLSNKSDDNDKYTLDNLISRIRFYDAFITSEGMYQSSLSLGKNWARMVQHLYQNPQFDQAMILFTQEKIPKHFIPLLGWGLHLQDYDSNEIKQFYYFQTLRDQISSSIRLGIIGPMEGVSLQKYFQDNFTEYLSLCENLTFENSYREFPALEFSQNIHEHLYSNIFQC